MTGTPEYGDPTSPEDLLRFAAELEDAENAGNGDDDQASLGTVEKFIDEKNPKITIVDKPAEVEKNEEGDQEAASAEEKKDKANK